MHIELSEDEALVLHDMLQTFESTRERTIALRHVAERNALWALNCQLEKQLVAPFRKDYDKLLDDARANVEQQGGPW